MRVSEERLATVLTRADHGEGLLETNPVATLIVESIAASHPEHSVAIRDAGRFFLDLLEANEDHATRLTLPVATQVLARYETLTSSAMSAYLAEIVSQDLLLGLSVQALLPDTGRKSKRKAERERAAVVRVLYLLVRMFEAQEEADVLERDFAR